MDKRHLAPSPTAGGGFLRVRDPDHVRRVPLPREGRVLPLTPYWRRRIARGDVVLVPDAEARKRPVEVDESPKREASRAKPKSAES